MSISSSSIMDVSKSSRSISAQMEREVRRARWAVRLDDMPVEWRKRGSGEWDELMRVVQPDERVRLARFVFDVDALRALVGRLLLRRALGLQFGRPHTQVLGRSKLGKPECKESGLQFNVSHDGDFVVLAMDSSVVGCDVMRVAVPGRNPAVEPFFADMQHVFTELEWALVRGRESERERLVQFFVLWTGKEAFIKATGDGMQFDLQRASLCYRGDEVPSVGELAPMDLYVDGERQEGWTVEHQWLDEEHVAAVTTKSAEVPRAPFERIKSGEELLRWTAHHDS